MRQVAAACHVNPATISRAEHPTGGTRGHYGKPRDVAEAIATALGVPLEQITEEA